MNKQSKILTAVIVVLAVVVALLGQQLYSTNQKLDTTKATLVSKTNNLDDVKSKLADSLDEIDSLSASLWNEQDQNDTYSTCTDNFGELKYYKNGPLALYNFKEVKNVYFCFLDAQATGL